MDRLVPHINFIFQRKWMPYLLLSIAAIYVIVHAKGRNDLDIFLGASKDLFEGKLIYSNTYFDGYHYYYSVLFALFIFPLTLIPAALAKVIWMAVCIAMLTRIAAITWKFLGSPQDASWKMPFFFILFLFMFRMIDSNLRLCQMTIPILYLSLEALSQIQLRRYIVGGVLLAIAINIKLMPLVFLPWLFYRAKWKSLITALLCIPLLYFLPVLWLGVNHNQALLANWWELINPVNTQHIIDNAEPSFHSLTTFLAVYFTDTSEDLKALPIARNILNLSTEQLHILILAVRAFFILFTLYFLRTSIFKSAITIEKSWWEWSYLFLASSLIFPHQQFYSFMLSMPAVAYLIRKEMIDPNKKIQILVFTVFLFFNAAILLGVFNAWYNHFKLITFGALILVICLAYRKPNKAVSKLNIDIDKA